MRTLGGLFIDTPARKIAGIRTIVDSFNIFPMEERLLFFISEGLIIFVMIF